MMLKKSGASSLLMPHFLTFSTQDAINMSILPFRRTNWPGAARVGAANAKC